MIKAPQDFCSGLIFATIGVLVFWVGWGYPSGTTSQISYGYFPRLLASSLCLVGTVIMTRAFLAKGQSLPRFALKPFLALIGVCAFGLLAQRAGLVISSFALIFISALASERFRPLDIIGLSLVLIPLNWLVFIKGLGMSLSAWPSW
jgi:hypothetical protein